MTRLATIRPEFVEFVPKDLVEGVLYISIAYRTAVHKCACGCGSKITTPIRPAQRRLTYDGEGVWLYPSIGNWSFPCQSHYWIEDNRIEWAKKWPLHKIEAGRARDKAARERYYSRHDSGAQTEENEVADDVGFVGRLWRRIYRG